MLTNQSTVGEADAVQNILDFEKDYPGSQGKFLLEEKLPFNQENSRRPTKGRITNHIQRNFGLKMTTVNKSFITVLWRTWQAVFVASTIDNIIREEGKSRIWKILVKLMLSLVLLKRPCSSLIFLYYGWRY